MLLLFMESGPASNDSTRKGYAKMAIPYSHLFSLQEQVIDISSIIWHEDQHAITINGKTITLTITEYRLLFPLRDGKPVTYGSLAHHAYSYMPDEKVRAMMDKHIDRIRGKLRGSGVYVYCVLGYGYLLLPEVVSEEVLHR